MKIISNILAIIFFSLSLPTLADNLCGELSRTGIPGPFDYSNLEHRKNRLPIVESFHFSRNVERLIKGDSTVFIGGDLSFTLRAFPNHYRALIAMSKLAIRDKTNQPEGAEHSVFCYFERAIRFKPDDAMVRSIFGSHLLKTGQPDMALEQLTIATRLEPNNPTFNYNLGLLFFDKKDYAQAGEYAKKAYSQDFPLPGLKNKLMSVGKWKN